VGIVLRFCHAETSDVAASGRTTVSGQRKSSGQFAENHRITSSYLRAVKVLASSSKRSKKRQSPAANRPTVAKLTERAPQYADAQSSSPERSSFSMAPEISRNFPTTQADSVGKFRLATVSEKSDKSAAMPTADQVRHLIQRLLAKAQEGPVAVSIALDEERNYLSDFLNRKKESIKPEVVKGLADRYNVPIESLIVKRKKRLRTAAA
jgi:hypothetical protein